jgi:hypothetical protein
MEPEKNMSITDFDGYRDGRNAEIIASLRARVAELERLLSEDYVHPLPVIGCLCAACYYERRHQQSERRDK